MPVLFKHRPWTSQGLLDRLGRYRGSDGSSQSYRFTLARFCAKEPEKLGLRDWDAAETFVMPVLIQVSSPFNIRFNSRQIKLGVAPPSYASVDVQLITRNRCEL